MPAFTLVWLLCAAIALTAWHLLCVGARWAEDESLTVLDDPEAGGSDPGAYADAIAHSPCLRVEDHAPISVSSHPHKMKD